MKLNEELFAYLVNLIRNANFNYGIHTISFIVLLNSHIHCYTIKYKCYEQIIIVDRIMHIFCIPFQLELPNAVCCPIHVEQLMMMSMAMVMAIMAAVT